MRSWNEAEPLTHCLRLDWQMLSWHFALRQSNKQTSADQVYGGVINAALDPITRSINDITALRNPAHAMKADYLGRCLSFRPV